MYKINKKLYVMDMISIIMILMVNYNVQILVQIHIQWNLLRIKDNVLNVVKQTNILKFKSLGSNAQKSANMV